MAETIATIEELQARLDWTLEAEEQGVAQAALDDLSDDARFYGSVLWESTNAPRQVKSLVLRAAARFMRNPDGYKQSRAGDETVIWNDIEEGAGTASFTTQEQKMLATLGGKGVGLYSASVVAYNPGTRKRTRYINPFTKDLGYDDVIYGSADSGLFPMQVDGEIA